MYFFIVGAGLARGPAAVDEQGAAGAHHAHPTLQRLSTIRFAKNSPVSPKFSR
jgi:hypothetical protein